MNIIGDRKSLDLYREMWVNLAYNQRYAGLVNEKDISTFRERLANEGLTFLTTSLPALGKGLDSVFSSGDWVKPHPLEDRVIPHFKLGSHGIPLFLGKAIKSAMNGDSRAVDCVRQLSYIFYKLNVQFDKSVVANFLDNFEKVDREVGVWTKERLEDLTLIHIAGDLISRVLCNANPFDILPRHGSGATACHTPNSEKYHHFRYSRKLDELFSYSDHFFFSPTHLADEMGKLEESGELDPQARVCLVPKDSRGPRVISCEPAEFMFIQQGLMRKLYETMETHSLTKGFINFEDQGVNKMLAYSSSIDGMYGTLDLTDASDRVSLNLVRALFPQNWVKAFEACRSESTKLPNGKIVKLQKFAPMGSSCCFPVEALVFWAIACASIRIARGSHPECYVYGDDIIVPTPWVSTVIDGLESVGLIVNRSKSYASGPFRESCGGDYHNGYDVTPVRVRNTIGASSNSIATDADLANSFIAKFGYGSVVSIVNLIDHAQHVPFPRSLIEQPCCLLSEPCASNDVFYRRRWNKNLQRWEHRVLRVSMRALACHEPDWCELLRKELTRGSESSTTGKYENPLSIMDSSLDPGCYVDPHSIHRKWEWVWLG